MGAIIKYDDPAQKLNSIEERLVSFVSIITKSIPLSCGGTARHLPVVSEIITGYGLYLRNDRQLCEEVVSGIECDYGIKRIFQNRL